MYYQVYNNELYHHGIKGMKWGIRKEYDGTSRKERKRRTINKRTVIIGAAATMAALGIVGYMKYNCSLKNMPIHMKKMKFGELKDLSKMNNKDIIIKSGTKFQRISSKSIEDYSREGERIFASFLRKDNHIYQHSMPKFIKDWQKQGLVDESDSIYKHILKTKTDIKAPSERLTAELYMEATKSKNVDSGKYLRFMSNLNNRDNKEVQTFFDLVRKSGYNAVVDLNDAGNYTKQPMILLDALNTVDTAKISKITKIGQIINVLTM